MSGDMRDYASGWARKTAKRRDVRQPKVRKGRQNPSSQAIKRGAVKRPEADRGV